MDNLFLKALSPAIPDIAGVIYIFPLVEEVN